VLELVAEGRSNRAISERLVLTQGAVQKHVSTIFNKLGLPAGEDDDRRILAVLAYLRPELVPTATRGPCLGGGALRVPPGHAPHAQTDRS
jgi:hypothetical protein